MSAMVSDAPPVLPPGSDKKSKKAKKEHKTKKRDREPDASIDSSERKSKKARQEIADNVGDDGPAPAVNGVDDVTTEGKKKKDKKRSRTKGAEQVVEPDAAMDVVESEAPTVKKEKKSKKSKNTAVPESQPEPAVEAPAVEEPTKKKKKRERKSKDHDTIAAAAAEAAAIEEKEAAEADGDAMDIDSTPVAKKTKKSSKSKSSSTSKATSTLNTSSADRKFPFFTQTVSLYLPLFPQGMTEPLEGYADQHLKLLVNRYVPDLKGILLAYRNPRLGERPGAKSLTENSGMEDVALLESIAEYAVAFGWFTAEVDIFRPTRGAWMEGKINLQSEGFVGVICFDMFNASIEASRLPEGWRWVDLMSSSKNSKTASDSTPDPFNENANQGEEGADGETEQLHTTGYWVDASGARVTGTLPFRIKNYEVGSSETHGYLSIEGTMLNEEDELARVLDERAEARRRKKHLAGGYLQRQIRRIPDFATTRFAADPLKDEEDEAQRAVQYKGTVAAGDESD
ncbi:hypothetical protein Micbo1qcDRAFT_167361 [Microdochium bolleyi]|uniref:DNA-directed RNA polymerase subunit n=1 Tax=Microdochium bolleyi TaxID=196109 RepID=A0A136ISG3_9PEZI|nr:hypothetical protein Micbo1qcDRAFT_167361 [Microdochium bolleyi]